MCRLVGCLTIIALVASCARPRDIFAPVPGAVRVVVADTTAVVLDAAARAISDRGVPIAQLNRERGMVESAYVDIAAVRSDFDAGAVIGDERSVRFRFRTIRGIGSTELYAEAVYQLGDFGGRATERMVPRGHPAREVLLQMLRQVGEELERARLQREAAPPPLPER